MNNLENEKLKDDEDSNYIVETVKKLSILFELSTWKNVFEWSKQNTSTALVWISGIGAIIQVIELISIHPSYIRFFSVTQLISDGSALLAIFILVTITYVVATIFMPQHIIKAMIGDINKKGSFNNYDKYMRYIAISIGCCIAAKAFMELNIDEIKREMTFYIIVIAVIIAFLRFALEYYNTFDKYLQETSDSIRIFGKFDFKYYYKAFNKFMRLATIMTIAIMSLKSTYFFIKASRLPYSLENYEIINDRIISDYKNLENYETLYFNDVYCFIKIKKNNEEQNKVIVYKTDEIMFQTKKIELEE